MFQNSQNGIAQSSWEHQHRHIHIIGKFEEIMRSISKWIFIFSDDFFDFFRIEWESSGKDQTILFSSKTS